MQDVLLLAVLTAIFAFGWIVAGKLDRFLEENQRAQELQLLSGGNVLRLGFFHPMAADSLADVLEQYSKLYPKVSVRIFCGSEWELLECLSAGKLDVIFLPENTAVPSRIQYHSRIISLNDTPLMMKYGGLPIEPVTDRYLIHKVIWTDTASDFTSYFLKCLELQFKPCSSSKCLNKARK